MCMDCRIRICISRQGGETELEKMRPETARFGRSLYAGWQSSDCIQPEMKS